EATFDRHDSGNAVVTSLYTNAYAIPVATLGHSLTTANVTARKILLYLPHKTTPQALCVARAGGWQPHAVPFIPPPHHESQGIGERFGDQYTKLNLWGLDELGVKAAVYLDGDTLVRKGFDELFGMPFEFAAVPDVFPDKRGFILGFNAGVLFLRPSSDTLRHMKRTLDSGTVKYPPGEAEQAFLNLYYGPDAVRLPYVYNANLAIKNRNEEVWEAMKDEIRVVHYTSPKPFPFRGGKMSTREEIERDIGNGKKAFGGLFEEEVGWW
ncbi:glycosyltransferase family 8 protein, partial [Stereum hirsutum FP-91666 SS1]|uniref:glycosyltransferase family 8 protein n=1 Tax=Stereum hirsutum (strain FP-91666) TaxID=721885 RepID=UPI000444928E